MSGSASRLFGVVGAGYTGAMLYNNGDSALRFAGECGRTLAHSLAKADAAAPPAGGADDALRRLSAEVAALAALVGARSGAALHSQQSSAPSATNALLLGGLGVGAAVAVLRLSDAGFDRIAWVTRQTFKAGVTELKRNFHQLTAVVRSVHAELSGSISALSGRVEDGLAAQAALAEDVAATRAGVSALGEQMAAVADGMDGLEQKVDGMAAKQDFACRGIYLLCSVVSRTLSGEGGGAQSGHAAGASSFAKLPAAGGANGGSIAAANIANATNKSLLELLSSGGPGAADPALQFAPMTGSVQEQLAAISSLAAKNVGLHA